MVLAGRGIGYKGLVQLAPRQLDLFRSPPSGVRPPESLEARAPAAPPTASEEAPSRRAVVAAARALALRMAEHLGPEVKVLLSVHDNRSTMVSFRRQPPVLKVRVHHMFLDAPASVVEALADYAGRGRRAAGQVLDDYIARRQEQIRALPKKASPLDAKGRCFDLQEILDGLNREHFEGAVQARIGWGRQTTRRRRKSIRLGVYDHKSREIRVHPALDRPDIPRFFVQYIVYHEMLHQLFPSDRPDGRNVHHPRAFRARERSFPLYQAAMAWEREHLSQLLRS